MRILFGRVATFWAPLVAVACGGDPSAPPVTNPTPPPATAQELVVRVLNVGQGDATLITNGRSTVIVDGGSGTTALGRWLDQFGVNGDTIDAVMLTHEHADHYEGLQELFRTSRRIVIRQFYENRNPSPNKGLAELRDSIAARVSRGQMEVRDTDTPCGTSAFTCTLSLDGGAEIHVLRPDPDGDAPNNRSVALKLVGPDSASFTMWLAGDAERNAIAFFGRAGYALAPGMQATVLKANHHGSCNGVTRSYLDAVRPALVVISVGAVNQYEHVHEQTKTLLRERSIPWLRTDINGVIELRTPGTRGGGYRVFVETDGLSRSGFQDGTASSGTCPPF